MSIANKCFKQVLMRKNRANVRVALDQIPSSSLFLVSFFYENDINNINAGDIKYNNTTIMPI